VSDTAATKPAEQPGADHPITIEPARQRVVVRVGDQVVADSTAALVLREANYPPRYYLPPGDIDAATMRPSTTTSYCPYKGDAGYVHLSTAGGDVRDAGWVYATPHEAVAPIAGHIAFNPDRVGISLE
jgi:uncharacterized protein (DUF427 family)